MNSSATQDGLRVGIRTGDPASRRCAPDPRPVSAPTVGLAHTALALLLLAALAAPAQAATLVSNFSQSDDGNVSGGTHQDIAQGFTTGSSGATLASIEIRWIATFANSAHATVTLHKDSATSAAVATLSAPAGTIGTAAANYTYTAPANTTLAASTTYYVVMEGGAFGLNARKTDSEDEDSGGQADWSIADAGKWRDGTSIGDFGDLGEALLIRVNGTATTTTVTVPGAPQDFAVSAGDAQVVLTWTAPASDGGAAITEYEYRHSTGSTVSSSATWTDVTDSSDGGTSTADELGVTVSSLTNGTGYAFEVRAVNSVGGGTATATKTATPSATSCAMPYFGDRRNIWTGSLTVGTRVDGEATQYGFFSGPTGNLNDTTFTIGSNNYVISGAGQIVVAGNARFVFGLTAALTATEKTELRLHVCNSSTWDFSASGLGTGTLYTWQDGLDWSSVSARTLYLSLPPVNAAATGEPTISGTATVGSTLTADKGTIADANGVPAESTFSYQWIRVDGMTEADLSATSSTYVLATADVGKNMKVKVSFTDLVGYAEARTSAAYPSSGTIVATVTVPGAPQNFEATAGNASVTLSWAAPASDGGGAITEYEYRYSTGSTVSASAIWTDVTDGSDAGDSTADETGVTISSLTNGTQYAFEVRAVNSAGDGTAAGPVTATPAPTVSIAAVYPKALIRVANPEFRVTISAAQTSAVTVNLSIDQDASYLSSTTQSIEIPANETSATGKFSGFYGGTTSGDLTATVVAGTGYVPAATPANAATVDVLAPGIANVLSYKFDATAYSVDEGDSAEVVVTLRTAANVPKPRESFSASAIMTSPLTGEGDMATQSAGGDPGDYTVTNTTGGFLRPATGRPMARCSRPRGPIRSRPPRTARTRATNASRSIFFSAWRNHR